MLCFVDIESTGLDPSKEKILEVACVITDDALNEVARFSRVTTEAKHHDLSKVDPYVLNMHVDNGLWNESLLAEDASDFATKNAHESFGAAALFVASSSIAGVDYALRDFIAKHCAETGEKKGPQLAGSTISFDRAFMQAHLPRAHALLHYRNCDVTTMNEFARRFWPAIHDARPRGAGAKHRALDDVLESLEVARYYARSLGPAALREAV